MGKATGFLEHGREDTPYRPVEERLADWNEVQEDPPVEAVQRAAWTAASRSATTAARSGT
jgi:hypothetical protein